MDCMTPPTLASPADAFRIYVQLLCWHVFKANAYGNLAFGGNVCRN